MAPAHTGPQSMGPKAATGTPTTTGQTPLATATNTGTSTRTAIQAQAPTPLAGEKVDLSMTDSEEDNPEKTSGQYAEGDPCEHRLCDSLACTTCQDCNASLCSTHGESSPCHAHNYMAQCPCPTCNSPPGLQGSRLLNDNDATPALEQWVEDNLLQTEDPLTLLFHEVQKKASAGSTYSTTCSKGAPGRRSSCKKSERN